MKLLPESSFLSLWADKKKYKNKKKIVLVDTVIAKDIIPNMLYSCSLIPMRNDKGFIAKTANIIQFPGTISTTCRKNVFNVRITFGNKVIVYDPADKTKRKSDIKLIAENLRTRFDLQNAQQVAEDFIDNACIIKRLYDQSQSNVWGKDVK